MRVPVEQASPRALELDLTPEEMLTSSRIEPCALQRSVDRFQLRELLGVGGFGDVYLAYDPRLDRQVALKLLKDPAPSARTVERFFREARAAAQLDHPNIVTLLDAGRDGSSCWISYHYIRGQTLARSTHAYRGRAASRKIARIGIGLARGLAHAHQRGVYHRDLKPSNVIIDLEGEPRLTDFGLARRVGIDPPMTLDGMVIGTPAYMSPEQAAGNSHLVDQRSDIFSLGLILLELLNGSKLAERPSAVPAWRVQQQQLETRSIGGRSLWGNGLVRVCRRAVARDPRDRYSDASEMVRALQKWLAGPLRAWRVPAIALLAAALRF